MRLGAKTSAAIGGGMLLVAVAGLVAASGCSSPAGSATLASCNAPGQCALVSHTCCGSCDATTFRDFEAVARTNVAVRQAALCSGMAPCPPCLGSANANVAAFCKAGACQAVDVRLEDVSSCHTDADCQLRGAGCCESCAMSGAGGLVALNVEGIVAYREQACAAGESCSGCRTLLSPGVRAVCRTSGHCAVEMASSPSGCFDSLPVDGSPCASPGLRCEYGDDPRPSCRLSATCGDTAWAITKPVCTPLASIGSGSCPLTIADNQDCPEDGLVCDQGDGALCACTDCYGSFCGEKLHWTCSLPPFACPPSPPDLGSGPCTPGLTKICVYSTCGTPLSAARSCNGSWIDVDTGCSP